MQYDFVSFGDITTDAFIRLKDARVHCEIDEGNCLLCVKFGQKIPYESVTEVRAVGNGPNTAVCAHRLGLSSAPVADIGDDPNGKNCLNALQERGIDTTYIRIHKGIPTNYHYVLQYEAERTILVKHQEFPYAFPTFPEPPRWLYLTSLPPHALSYQDDIVRYVKEHDVKLAFQPGTFQIKAGKDLLKHVYSATEIFFCNKEEAQEILKTKESNMKTLLSGIRSLGPKIAAITNGRNGASIADDTGAWSSPMYPDPAPPISRTGAGDATSSTTVAYMILGLEPKEALRRGMVNSAYVVQSVGAQAGLLTKKELEKYLAGAPPEFTMSPLK
ncbi:MAG TPA: carbohydrate kinase family protein [Candidatus Paceibacterota bacterium]